MDLKLLKRRSWTDESGVSEIVGNILILMITVVLFSGIMAFVNQMPVPEMSTKTDFSAGVKFDNLGTTAELSITHVGGAVLKSTDTIILVEVDELTYPIRLSEDDGFTLSEWSTGVTWSRAFDGTSYSSIISVTIVDAAKHTAIWVSQVSGGSGGNPPTILQRYIDSNPVTPTVDPVKSGDDYSFFVRVIDLDNDLDTSQEGVWIDSSEIDGQVVNVYDHAEAGWFRWDFGSQYSNATQFDGKTLVIHARDHAGHETISSYKISVVVLPSDRYVEYITDADPGEGGMPSYIKNINDGQGFGVFGENKTVLGRALVSDPRTNFTAGERVFVRVASMYITNVFGLNDLTIVDTRSNIDYSSHLVFEPDFTSTLADPFYAIAYGGNVYLYQAVFNTSALMPGTYSMVMTLKASGTSNYIFTAEVNLIIWSDDSPVTYFPKAWVYNEPTYTDTWGYSRTSTFNATGTNFKMYVAIQVQDTQVSPAPSVGEIRITDMTGGSQLYGPPDSGGMISSVSPSGTNATSYVFWIDLRLINGDNWRAGTNSYTLNIGQFSDENEGVYAFSTQVFIRSSTLKSDFFIGTSGIYSTKGGSTNFINPEYVYFVENNNFFTTKLLYYQENSPSTAPTFYHNAMALGDMDGDGDLDLIVGSNMDKQGTSYSDYGVLLYFENTMNTFGVWQSPSYLARPAGDSYEHKIEWIAIGDIDGDGDNDFAYSTGGSTAGSHKVVVYNNTYGAGGTVFQTYNSTTATGGIRKIALEDMNGDGCADLIVLAEGKIFMYDLTKWKSGCFAQIPNPDLSPAVTSNIIDFDIADMNNDGMPDVITVDATTGSGALIRGVWVNHYTPNPTPTVVSVDVDEDEYPSSGIVVSGTLSDTVGLYTASLVLGEDEAGADGQVSFIFRMDSPLTSDTDQQLVVRAKVSADAHEVFYVWYTTDSDPVNGKYTPVMVISDTSYRNYTFNLPQKVAGATYFYVKITDSSKQLGLTVDQVYLDYIAIESNRFGSYWPATGTPDRYQVAGTGTYELYTTARAMNFNGLEDDRLEVAVAKNGKWVVFDYQTPVTVWMVQNQTNFHVTSAGLSSAVSISPTLFQVADINGDGYDDILTVWVTTGSSSQESMLRVYLNVDPDFYWAVDVKDAFLGMLAGTETGAVVSLLVGDIFSRG